jgi:hypothetical protein
MKILIDDIIIYIINNFLNYYDLLYLSLTCKRFKTLISKTFFSDYDIKCCKGHLKYATRIGSITQIKYLHFELNWPWDLTLLNKIIKYKQYDLLEWLNNNGFPWNETILNKCPIVVTSSEFYTIKRKLKWKTYVVMKTKEGLYKKIINGIWDEIVNGTINVSRVLMDRLYNYGTISGNSGDWEKNSQGHIKYLIEDQIKILIDSLSENKIYGFLWFIEYSYIIHNIHSWVVFEDKIKYYDLSYGYNIDK